MSENRQKLNVLFDEALRQYKEFLLTNKPTDQRSFIEHQSACRAALGHLLLLEKLLRDGGELNSHEALLHNEQLERLLSESVEVLEAESKINDQ